MIQQTGVNTTAMHPVPTGNTNKSNSLELQNISHNIKGRIHEEEAKFIDFDVCSNVYSRMWK